MTVTMSTTQVAAACGPELGNRSLNNWLLHWFGTDVGAGTPEVWTLTKARWAVLFHAIIGGTGRRGPQRSPAGLETVNRLYRITADIAERGPRKGYVVVNPLMDDEQAAWWPAREPEDVPSVQRGLGWTDVYVLNLDDLYDRLP